DSRVSAEDPPSTPVQSAQSQAAAPQPQETGNIVSTPIPTVAPVVESPVQVESDSGIITAQLPSVSHQTNPLINIQTLSRNTIFIILVSIITALVIDVLIIERKKIPRFVGHNWDHIM